MAGVPDLRQNLHQESVHVADVTDAQTARTREIAERFYGAVVGAEWDPDSGSGGDLLHDDVELHEPEVFPYGGVYRGKEAIRDLQAKIAPLVDYESIRSEGLFAEGERAFCLMSSTTVDGEPLLGGEEIVLRDGKIARIRVLFYDPMPLVREATKAGVR